MQPTVSPYHLNFKKAHERANKYLFDRYNADSKYSEMIEEELRKVLKANDFKYILSSKSKIEFLKLHYYFSDIKSLSKHFNGYDMERIESFVSNVWNTEILKKLIEKYEDSNGEEKISTEDKEFLEKNLNFDVTKYDVHDYQIRKLPCYKKKFTTLLAIPTETDAKLQPFYEKLKNLIPKPHPEFICEIIKDEDYRKIIKMEKSEMLLHAYLRL